MFDIGFPELVLVAIVGLLVIGPERLPEALRTLGLWLGRMRRSFTSVKNEIEKEIGMDEVRRQLHNEAIMEEMKRIESEVRSTADDVRNTMNDTANSIDPHKATGNANTGDSDAERSDSETEQPTAETAAHEGSAPQQSRHLAEQSSSDAPADKTQSEDSQATRAQNG
jgi:sec-independent protein translocase protein TatB